MKQNLKVAQSRQKSYADTRRRDLVFEIRDFVYLKVSPMKGVKRFHTKGKLSPRYVGPFKIIDKSGEVAYQLQLIEQLSSVHDVFHVSHVKKCLRVLSTKDARQSTEGYPMMVDLSVEVRVIRNRMVTQGAETAI